MGDAIAVLPDVLAPDLRVVFCGSAAGTASARAGAYYAGPGNRFWPTLHEVGLTPHPLAPRDFPIVIDYGIGLTDLAKYKFGPDMSLSSAADDPAALRTKILRHRPRTVAFVGKRAAAVVLARRVGYGRQPETIGTTTIHVLPSPSGAARAFWDIEPWYALAADCGVR